MARKELMALYGRLGLIVAAFAFIAGIVAAPLLQRAWFSDLTVTEHNSEPALLLPKTPVAFTTEKQG